MPKIKQTGIVHSTITGFDFRIDAALSPAKTIRALCLSCCNGSVNEVAKCEIFDCPNYLRRFGRLCDKDGNIVRQERSAAQIAASQKGGEMLRARKTAV